ncbi:monooxygenase [Mycolicibacterium thermoresistibile]
MSTTLLQMDFPATGPWGREMAEAYADLATDIATTEGLRWKIWTESRADQLAGGIYLFETREAAEAYAQMHTQRLAGFGVSNVRIVFFDVNVPLTDVTRGPLG